MLLWGSGPAAAQEFTAAADAYLKAEVAERKFMGTVLIARHGQVLFERAYGWADAEWKVPNTPQTIFRIGSLTKQFTAAAVVKLAQEGKLQIEDPVARYYAGLPRGWQKITLHQLLTHTSGIPDYTRQPRFWDAATRPETPAEIVDGVQDKPLEFAPGSKWAYSNTGYILLGIVIEEVSGKKYAEYMKQELFEPLGMNDTGYDSPQIVLPRRAHGYVPSGEGIANAPYIDMSVPYAAGALDSTARDLLRWDQALATGKLLTKHWRERIFTGYTPTDVGGSYDYDYGYGWFVAKPGRRAEYAHEGSIPGFNSKMDRFQESGLFIIVLSNLSTPDIGKITAHLASLTFGEPVPALH